MSTKKNANAHDIFESLISYWNLSGYKELAKRIGVNYQTLMAWKKRNSIGDYAPFMDKGISKSWLETGLGDISKATHGNSDNEFITRDWTPEYISLPVYCGDCGPGRLNEPEPESWMTFTSTFARATFGTNGNTLACLRATGDSMQPSINPGDLVVINITESGFFHDGAIYALQIGDTTSIKRLYRLPGGVIRISSDNPSGWSKDLRSEEVEAEGIRIAGRVVFIGKLA